MTIWIIDDRIAREESRAMHLDSVATKPNGQVPSTNRIAWATMICSAITLVAVVWGAVSSQIQARAANRQAIAAIAATRPVLTVGRVQGQKQSGYTDLEVEIANTGSGRGAINKLRLIIARDAGSEYWLEFLQAPRTIVSQGESRYFKCKLSEHTKAGDRVLDPNKGMTGDDRLVFQVEYIGLELDGEPFRNEYSVLVIPTQSGSAEPGEDK